MHNYRFLGNCWFVRLLSIRCVPVAVRVSIVPTIVVNFACDPHLIKAAHQSVRAVRLCFRLFWNRFCLRLLSCESIQQLCFKLEAVDAKLARRLQSSQIGMKSPELVALEQKSISLTWLSSSCGTVSERICAGEGFPKTMSSSASGKDDQTRLKE